MILPLHKTYTEYPLAASWQERLASAASPSEIVAVARDYLATFPLAEIAAVPEQCKPTRMVSAQDVADFAFVLVRHDCSAVPGAESVMHRLAVFFANANARLGELNASGRLRA